MRVRLRHARRRHHPGSLTDALTDIYVGLLFVAMYGWAFLDGIRSYLDSPAGRQGEPGQVYWITVAAALVLASLAWRGLRTVGPLLVTPAAQAWVVSSPVDRGALLAPRFIGLVVGAVLGTGLLGSAVSVAAGATRPSNLGWPALAGAAWGAAAVALSVVAQASPSSPRWAVLLDRTLAGTGTAIALLVVVGHVAGWVVPAPSMALAPAIAITAVPLAVGVTIWAWRSLGKVDRASLVTGAQFANAAAGAAMLLDPTMLTVLVESRRWRSVGRVRGRPFRRTGRFVLLIQAELRRLTRHTGAVGSWAALLLTMYAVAVALPAAAGTWQVILGFLATCRLTGGLRSVGRSPRLRRTLGGADIVLRLAHLVVPAAGATIWYLASLPLVRPAVSIVDVVLLLGIVAAAYRAGTRPPMEHGGVLVDTPMGMMSIDVVRQVIRGPDLVAVMVIAEMSFN